MNNLPEEFARLAMTLWPHMENRLKRYINECLRAKSGLVTAVNGGVCDVLLNANSTDDEYGEPITGVPVASGINLQTGDRVLVEYYYSLNNAFVRTKFR